MKVTTHKVKNMPVQTVEVVRKGNTHKIYIDGTLYQTTDEVEIIGEGMKVEFHADQGMDIFGGVDEVHWNYPSIFSSWRSVAIEGWLTDEGDKTGSTYALHRVEKLIVTQS